MDGEITKAIVQGNKIICGKCGHKIAEIKGVIITLGRGTIYLMCKHRSEGTNCKTINEIKVN